MSSHILSSNRGHSSCCEARVPARLVWFRQRQQQWQEQHSWPSPLGICLRGNNGNRLCTWPPTVWVGVEALSCQQRSSGRSSNGSGSDSGASSRITDAQTQYICSGQQQLPFCPYSFWDGCSSSLDNPPLSLLIFKLFQLVYSRILIMHFHRWKCVWWLPLSWTVLCWDGTLETDAWEWVEKHIPVAIVVAATWGTAKDEVNGLLCSLLSSLPWTPPIHRA